MSEREIVKHTKNIFAYFRASEKSIKHRLADIFIEIVIIVLAVSISIWFHNWSERQHDRKEEKEFFTGFKKDLQVNMENMTSSENFYESMLQGVHYFLKYGEGEPMATDSINKYSDYLLGSTDLDPHTARYEGMKSSGRFKIIENSELLNSIIDLDEGVIQRIQDLNQKYFLHKEKIVTLICQNAALNKKGKMVNAGAIVSRSDFIMLMRISAGVIQYNIIPAHKEGIKLCREIMAKIDRELGKK